MKKWVICPLWIVILAGCVFYPQLTLEVDEEMAAGSVEFCYSFTSERSLVQSCRWAVFEVDGEEPLIEKEVSLERQGVISVPLKEPGEYRIRFAVLSQKGRKDREIPYMIRSTSFRVVE